MKNIPIESVSEERPEGIPIMPSSACKLFFVHTFLFSRAELDRSIVHQLCIGRSDLRGVLQVDPPGDKERLL
jgi:hypothetical protein